MVGLDMRIPFALGRTTDCARSLRSPDRNRPRGCTGPIPGVDDRPRNRRVGVVEPQAHTGSGAAADAAAGKAVFADNCSTCHGALGRGGNGGPDLASIPNAKNVGRVIEQVTNGGAAMPPFKSTLSEQQIKNVAAYVTTKIAK